MADKKSKFKQNAPGKFYVDELCIACDACTIDAPHFFEMNNDEEHAFVKLQPRTDKEIKLCEEALENCPVAAIGDDEERAGPK